MIYLLFINRILIVHKQIQLYVGKYFHKYDHINFKNKFTSFKLSNK